MASEDDEPRPKFIRRDTIATMSIPGREGKFVAKGSHVGEAIAVFTSGGDAQGQYLSIDTKNAKIAWKSSEKSFFDIARHYLNLV